MGRALGWITALGLALGVAGPASAAMLPPILTLPLSVDTVPSVAALPAVAAPPPASFQISNSESTSIWGHPPEPTTVVLLATGLAGLVVLGHREFV